jgi:hypothetical protein
MSDPQAGAAGPENDHVPDAGVAGGAGAQSDPGALPTAPKHFENAEVKQEEKNRVKTTIARVYDKLVNLTVVTTVGGVGVELYQEPGSPRVLFRVNREKATSAFLTQMNLLEGDVTTSLPDNYAELASVQELHERNVTAAAKVLPDNITALVNAGREVIALFDK